MKCTEETFKLFSDNNYGLVSMTEEKQVYDTTNGYFLFFYPKKNRMTLNKLIGRNKDLNMPVVETSTNVKEWKDVNNNEVLSKILTKSVMKNEELDKMNSLIREKGIEFIMDEKDEISLRDIKPYNKFFSDEKGKR